MIEGFLFTHALREFFRFRRMWPWLAISAALALIGMFVWPRIDEQSPAIQQYATLSSMFVLRLVGLASAIFTTSIVSQEVAQKTIVYLLTRPVPRWKLITMRYLASVIAVSFIGIVSAVVLSAGVFQGNIASNGLLLNDCKAIVIGAIAYGGLFLLVSLMFNRAMIICVLFVFGWETTIPNLPGDLYHFSVLSYMQAIAEHPDAGGSKGVGLLAGQLGNNLITASSAYPVMILLSVATVVLSAWWFTHFEYVPREDAE